MYSVWKDIWERKVSDTYGMSDTGGLSEDFMTDDENSDNKEEPIDIQFTAWI